MRAEVGDKISALGFTFQIAEILYQDFYYDINQNGNYDIEFIDTKGKYHHWKQELDGGRLIKISAD